MAVQTIYSNKDSRVYKSESLIVPPTLPTGEAPLELNQPNMILDAKYNYRLIQLSAIVKITNILQPIINQNIDEYVTLCRRFGNKEEHPKIGGRAEPLIARRKRLLEDQRADTRG